MAESVRKEDRPIDFVPMSSIAKVTDDWDARCTDWAATEKVHGSSFQLYTNDGLTVHTGSRRRNLDCEESFLKCNIRDLVAEYKDYVIKFWHAISSDDAWDRHKGMPKKCDSEDDNPSKHRKVKSPVSRVPRNNNNTNNINNNVDDCDRSEKHENQEESDGVTTSLVSDTSELKMNGGNDDFKKRRKEPSQDSSRVPRTNVINDANDCDMSDKLETQIYSKENTSSLVSDSFQLRIYGELYGGGGVGMDTNRAIQKEIIYCDNYRFYVFGATINRKWLTVLELGALCREAGFPYFAEPVNEIPMETADALKQWLNESGLMRRRSAMTERVGDNRTFIEGYVLTPLTKVDDRLHAIKYLAPAFDDVRTEQRTNKKTKTVYCTKQRYHSVLSKLEERERRHKDMVVGIMIDDIIAESQELDPSKKQRKVWRRMVTRWLREDGYWTQDDEEEGMRKRGRGKNEEGGQDEGGVKVEEEEVEENESLVWR